VLVGRLMRGIALAGGLPLPAPASAPPAAAAAAGADALDGGGLPDLTAAIGTGPPALRGSTPGGHMILSIARSFHLLRSIWALEESRQGSVHPECTTHCSDFILSFRFAPRQTIQSVLEPI